MSMAPKQAETLLEKQIAALGNVRNAGTRAPEFREWRQATLTLIERIWPDQPTRAQRFRRIPFSVATAKDEREAREAFERGCAEGRRLLNLWLTEISTHGIREEPEAPRLTEAVRLTLDELHPPMVLDEPKPLMPAAEEPAPPPVVAAQPKPRPAPRPVPKPAARARKRKEKLSEMLGFDESRATRPPAAQAPPAPARPAPVTKPAPPAMKLPPAIRPAAAAPAALVRPPVPPAPPMAKAPARPPAPPPARTPDADSSDPLAHSIDSALERALHDTEAAAGLVFAAHRPAEAPEGPRERPMVSYVARAFIGMARDLEELGVPEEHQDRVRLALLDLARHLDAGSVTWHLMRDAITLVMHYPPLGRQALPLLLPYLESAA